MQSFRKTVSARIHGALAPVECQVVEGVSELRDEREDASDALLAPAHRRHPMELALGTNHAPVPPPSYHRSVASALHLVTLTLVTR